MLLASRPFGVALALVATLAASAGCAPRVRGGESGDTAPDGQRGRGRGRTFDPTAVYAGAGLIAQAQPIPFVGNVLFLAGSSPDSTLLLLTLSMPNRALSFATEGEAHQARYLVVADVRRDGAMVAHAEARQVVRVGSFRETGRTDESVIFQQYVSVHPGTYALTVSVRDEGSGRSGQQELRVTVPRLAGASLSSPVAVYQAVARVSTDTTPELIANPRATVFFGRDTAAHVYIEGYGIAPGIPISIAVQTADSSVVWRDSVIFPPAVDSNTVQGSVVSLPVARLGVGRLTVIASTPAATATRTPLFVSFGDEWSIASFEEMLNYLRYFASAHRLQELRGATGEARAAAWSEFYRETDPDPRTPEHEGLRDYFARIQFSNERFNEEGTPGWLTDRGKVYSTLGEPDQLLEQGDRSLNTRGRAQIWTYARYRLQLVFVDQSGFGRWRLTPRSDTEFTAVAMRERK
ncbi:MAG: GWxTD domain-containing protein [Gemmatimonadota bacterium]|nr:GWxTD domain-containing protein [Gemmatimonadota bacterium]